MAGLVKKGTFNIVRQVAVDAETLGKIAELLGIPAAERGQIISGIIYIGASPPPSGGSAAQSYPGEGAASPPRRRSARSSPTSGRRRQPK